MPKTISETFAKSSDGWTLAGDVQSSGWQATGGDPKGYLGWVDAATGDISYFQAGMKFLGNHVAFYGGTLSYDILDSGNGLTAYDVKIVGDGKTLEYTNPNDASFPTSNVWTSASVPLVAADFVDVATGLAPKVSEMKLVLKDITELDIRAEYVNGAETGGLDNVVLARAAARSFDGLAGAHPIVGRHLDETGTLHHVGMLGI